MRRSKKFEIAKSKMKGKLSELRKASRSFYIFTSREYQIYQKYSNIRSPRLTILCPRHGFYLFSILMSKRNMADSSSPFVLKELKLYLNRILWLRKQSSGCSNPNSRNVGFAESFQILDPDYGCRKCLGSGYFFITFVPDCLFGIPTFFQSQPRSL